jgi:hypothetical protein
VIANLLFFGLCGLGLMTVGLWGMQRAGQLSAVEGWDEQSQARRRAVIRRGCAVCMAVGGVFLVLAAASPFLSPGP